MSSALSTLAIKNKVREFILTKANDTSLNSLVEEAVKMADRELRDADSLSPLAWDIVPYDGLRTKPYAKISALTQADPGVFTAASIDSDVTGHGFDNHSTIRDIVVIDGIDGPEELNKRAYGLQYVSATKFSLKTLDLQDAIDTSSLDEYSDGGTVYHAGYVLNTTTILANVSNEWTVKQLLPSPTFDGFGTNPITEVKVRNEGWLDVSLARRPHRYRYWQHMTAPNTMSHYVFWYPVSNYYYNFAFNYQKEVPDISTFNNSTYPFHPNQCHEYLWHGALAKLVGVSKRMLRQGDENNKQIVTKMEILWAERWLQEWEKDKAKTVNLSRHLLGDSGGSAGFTG